MRTELAALKNLLSECELLLETLPPLPGNRTARCRELLASARAPTGDLLKQAKTPSAVALGRRGDGNPDPRHISISYVERSNLTMRMQMRRLTRLTNAFSKSLKHLEAATALHFAYYNFCRVHNTLRVTPAMEAGIADHGWTIAELMAAV
jgi:hypothetical protein